ncbi:MAG: PAS domain-containing protein [Opitutaceae bacterium]|nr:PAS domain-containing protein [Opitutaceae bacterium]
MQIEHSDSYSAAADLFKRTLERPLFKVIADNAFDAIVLKDRESRIVAANKSAAAKHGRDNPDDLVGKSDYDFFADSFARDRFDVEQQVIRTKQPVIDKVEREVWRDNRVTWAVTKCLPLHAEDGVTLGTIGVSKDVTRAKEEELVLRAARRDLASALKLAGTADVATGVLHDVRNVLVSLDYSARVIRDGLLQMRVDAVRRLCSVLEEHKADLSAFMTFDTAGQRLPVFASWLNSRLADERAQLLQEAQILLNCVEHVTDVVAEQQSYAAKIGSTKVLSPQLLMDSAVRLYACVLKQYGVRVEREYQDVPTVLAEKGKVLQVLVNLLSNANSACAARGSTDRLITVRLERGEKGQVCFVVRDNGVGIAVEDLGYIFKHGFSTRADGHGFGLHFSALAAKEMKGALHVHSGGLGHGASFTLELPAATSAAEPNQTSDERRAEA